MKIMVTTTLIYGVLICQNYTPSRDLHTDLSPAEEALGREAIGLSAHREAAASLSVSASDGQRGCTGSEMGPAPALLLGR